VSFLSDIKLTQFRCYEAARLAELRSGLVVLHGPNGAGKTNILEAISMLSPGRGLRGAKVSDMQKIDGREAWAIAATVQSDVGAVKVGTGLDPVKDKRIVRINGVTAKAQTALSDYLACIWLTPQMDGLFIEGASGRRRFLDRLIFAYDPGHSGRVTRYENAMRQRSKLLQGDEKPDPAWLDSLEAQMAETGIAIAAARLDFIQKLQTACDAADDTYFPRAILRLTGTVEELLTKAPAVEVEDMLRYQFQESRKTDAKTGGAASGPHKSDLQVLYAAKNMPADQCSTGEQKALLIGIILAHAQLMAAERGAPPILLLDEVAAHLDENRRAGLYDLLRSLGGQVFMTGTDESLFEAIQNSAQFFTIESAQIIPRKQGLAA
jgi:DNA replication and repair protein RecF